MNFVDVNDQLANVAQIVRKCPTVTLRRAYVRALREWCQQTQWLRTNVIGATVAEQAQYSLGNDANLDIIGIYAMQASQVRGNTRQYWTLPPTDSGFWNANVVPGQPVRYCYVPEDQFALNPTPNDVFDLTITTILQPKDGSVNIPEAPLLKYSNEIEAGALAYLLMIPGMPWSNPTIAQGYSREFRSGISNGKAEAQRQFNIGAQRAKPRRFFA
jgi:hypothetical protein